jgi:hypothetical protein
MNALDLRTALDRDADLVGEPSPDLLDQLVRRRQHQRRQRAGILATAAAVVVIGAGIPVVSSLTMRSDVAPATQPTTASTPAVTTEAAPTTSAVPAPSSSADPTTAPASTDPEPAALVLGPDGLGPLKLGMTISEAEATGMVEPFRNEPISDRCLWRSRLDDAPEGTAIVFHDSELGVATIAVAEGVVTPEGIGIGSPRADVDRAYPGMSVIGESRAYSFVPGNEQATYRIEFEDEKVTHLTLQYVMQGCYE